MSQTSLSNMFRKSFLASLRARPQIFDGVKRVVRLASSHNEIYQVLKNLHASRDRISFLQIGAHDGLICDPIREFVISGRWEGCLVEPLPDVFAKLRANYHYTGLEASGKLRFVNAAVSSQEGQVILYQVGKAFASQVPDYARLLTSMDRQHLLQHLSSVPGADQMIEELVVPCMTPLQVMNHAALSELDLLLVDVEGHEFEVFAAFPFATVRPGVIIYESVHLSTEHSGFVSQLLIQNGYTLNPSGNDTIALRS